jgi:threonine dehydrogenase-like Zn-dependent dehydrogenase
VRALVVERSVPRFAAARLASSLGSGRGAGVGPLRLVDIDEPRLPGPGWHRVRPVLSGICGSDLATVDGRSSRYFEDLVSFPFVPGHEVVGTLEPGGNESSRGLPDGGGDVSADPGAGEDRWSAGTRVVIEPVLGCLARAVDPPCAACAEGRTGNCERVAFGHLRPGLQTGYCTDTGGGWSAAGLVAHRSQIHAVPDHLTLEDAVTVEPLACALHAVLGAGVREGETVAVLGAGTLGLLATAALAHLAATGRTPAPGDLLVGARYPHQRRLAAELGATDTLPPDQLARAVRRRSRSLALGTARAPSQRLTGGADVVLDCVGSGESIAESLALVRPRGRVVLLGMPARLHLDLAPLWHREVSLAGAYAYGTELLGGPPGGSTGSGVRTEPVRTFDLALEVAAAVGTGRLVSAAYPLERFEEAVAHAGAAGRRGSVKIVFDLRQSERVRQSGRSRKTARPGQTAQSHDSRRKGRPR